MSFFFQSNKKDADSKLERIWNIIIIAAVAIFLLYQLIDSQLQKRSFEKNKTYTVARLQKLGRDSEDRWLEFKFFHQGYPIETWQNVNYRDSGDKIWRNAQRGGFYLVAYDSTNPSYAQVKIPKRCLDPKSLIKKGVKVPVHFSQVGRVDDRTLGIKYALHYQGALFKSYALIDNFQNQPSNWIKDLKNGTSFISICPHYPILNEIEMLSQVNQENLKIFKALSTDKKLPQELML